MTDIRKAFTAINLKFQSTNDVPVEKSVVTAPEWRELEAEIDEAIELAFAAGQASVLRRVGGDWQ